MGEGDDRPLARRWEELLRARLSLYRRAALTVRVDGATSDAVARRVAGLLGGLREHDPRGPAAGARLPGGGRAGGPAHRRVHGGSRPGRARHLRPRARHPARGAVRRRAGPGGPPRRHRDPPRRGARQDPGRPGALGHEADARRPDPAQPRRGAGRGGGHRRGRLPRGRLHARDRLARRPHHGPRHGGRGAGGQDRGEPAALQERGGRLPPPGGRARRPGLARHPPSPGAAQRARGGPEVRIPPAGAPAWARRRGPGRPGRGAHHRLRVRG